jgi:hypothetical protein
MFADNMAQLRELTTTNDGILFQFAIYGSPLHVWVMDRYEPAIQSRRDPTASCQRLIFAG